jgi:predicted ribosome quality control (RQC) complex YloA/Tae2 family protein
VTKTPKSFSITEENAEYLERNDHLNNSALVNDLLEQYRKKGSVEGIVDQIERRRLEQEQESLERQLETVRESLESLASVEEKQAQRRSEDVNGLVNRVEQGKRLFEGHAAVKQVATDHFGGDVSAVLDAVEAECKNRGIEYDTDQLGGQ